MSKTVNKLSFTDLLTFLLTGQYSFSCFAEKQTIKYSGNKNDPGLSKSIAADNSGNVVSAEINSGNDPQLRSGIRLLSEEMPDHCSLNQNHPNPFTLKTLISYQCSMPCFVSLKVYDIQWKEISALVYKQQTSGTYQVEFDGSHLPDGIYFYRMDTENFSDTKKMFIEK